MSAMRKWVLIGVIAIVAFSGIVFVIVRPKKGSVEYHKKAFLEAHYTEPWVHNILARAPKELRSAYFRRKEDEIDFHRRSLVELGFLAEQVFVISNQPTGQVADLLRFEVAVQGGSLYSGQINFAVVREETTNSIRVIGLRNRMDELVELVRKCDVPKKGK